MINIFKGWLGEKTTTFAMWLFFDKNVYRRVDNIIVPAHDGTTQIDHVLVSIYGIFVVETKNIRGWIFGSTEQNQWTSVIYGKKYPFQNPLRQNYRHTKCLSEYLGLDHELFQSVVFFISECEFKTEMPFNVLNRGFKGYLERFTKPCLSPDQVQDIEVKLTSLKAGNAITKAEHLHSLEVRHQATDSCPRCGSPLVERKARATGNSFLGCKSYPRCKFTRNI